MLFAIYVLCHILLTASFQLIVLYKCYCMFYRRSLDASPLLLSFFIYLSIVSSTGLIYSGYVLIFWRPDEILYNNVPLYFIGLVPWILLISNPIFEFALCIERCFAVLFPHSYSKKSKQILCFSALIFSILVLTFTLWVNRFLWIPPNETSFCRYFSCVITTQSSKYMNIYKIVISVAEVFAALILILLVKIRRVFVSKKGKRKNMVILMIILSTVLFEFGPNILDTVYLGITGLDLVNVIGPYRTTLSTFNICISAVLYTFALKKPQKGVQNLNVPFFVTSSSK